MPPYDYACKACGHRFEHFQSMSSDPLTKCPECEKDELKRLIGAGSALIFKGSGFYITDYRSKGYSEAKSKAESSSSGGSSDKSASASAGSSSSSTASSGSSGD
mgnify:CR=1 FL=1